MSEAITICNTNQAQKSEVKDLPHGDEEYAVLQSICRNTVNTHVKNSVTGKWQDYRKVLLKVRIKRFNSDSS